ncbi:disulfide bond formation protein B [Limobrevibacterium gyesilva]|uniref:Disulfide bond formation protein B n=1 Tax=Limobrevibacterium gyesilva TaxID=2991712 RepID=A0AA41YQ45_9PROT|nr:disulfide bond formation protein B [Limobrevibacterium gyesilva]MCW3474430.1 disulfide bond formation protein B [Limobrevibacterium gyesilva]
MMIPRLKVALALSALTAAAALGIAFASEWYGGLVPCALCLIERWPYRIAIALGLVGLVLPRALARIALVLLALSILAGAAAASVHVGVEQQWWPSPLPECAAPKFATGSIADRLASMPAKPSKPCDEPIYLIPGLPVSMAAMNLIFALGFAGGIATFLWTTRRSAP